MANSRDLQVPIALQQPVQSSAGFAEHRAASVGLGSRLALADLSTRFLCTTGLTMVPGAQPRAAGINTAARLETSAQHKGGLVPPAPPKSSWESSKAQAQLLLDERLQKLQQQQVQGGLHEDGENTNPNSAAAAVPTPQGYDSSMSMPSRDVGRHTSYATLMGAHPPAREAFAVRMGSNSLMPQPSQHHDSKQVLSSSKQTGQTGGAWEQQQARAILALEQERDSLLLQLDQYVWHKQQLVQLHAKHAKALKDAQGTAGQRLRALSKSAAAMLAMRQLRQRVARAIAVWRHEAQRTHKLKLAEHTWHLHVLQPFFVAWHVLTLEAKRRLLPAAVRARLHEAVLAWAQQAKQLARLNRLGAQCAGLRLRHLLWAWRDRALWFAYKAAAVRRAAQHQQLVLLHKAWHTLHHDWCWAQRLHDVLSVKLQRLRLRNCHQAWHSQVRRQKQVSACIRRHRARRVLLSWQHISHKLRLQRQLMSDLQARWLARRGQAALRFWHAYTAYITDLHSAEQQLQRRVRRHGLKHAFRQLSRGVRLQQMEQGRDARHLYSTWTAWRTAFCRRQRNGRVVAAAQASQLLHVAKAALQAWMLLAVSRRVRLQEDDAARMQAYVSQLQQEVQQVHSERYAAVTLARSHEERALAMEQAAQCSLLQSAGSLVGCRVQWQAVQPSAPDSSAPFISRMQHHAHWLQGLQPANPLPQAAIGPADTYNTQQNTSRHHDSAMLAMSATAHNRGSWVVAQDVLLVFGGVGEGAEWLRDIDALTITHMSGGELDVQWSAVPLDTSQLPAGRLPAVSGAASCSAGPTSFVVIGGYNGIQESMDIYLFQVGAIPNDTDRHTGTASGLYDHPNSGAFPSQFSARAELIQPRNSQLPKGRTGHSAFHHWPSRTVLVFGGYASESGGCLCDLWVLQMDTLTWWQPDTLGDCPARRRGHIAAVIGNTLYVHGGYDGQSHFSDTWQCDLETWTWCCLQQQGVVPCARRGHACTVIEDHYLLITGGYDGIHHLADAYVLDTHNGLWQQLDMSGTEVGECPPPCALHTLTLAGSSCVQLGGCGALGAMASCHLLQPRGLMAAQQQQQALAHTTSQLAAAVARCGELQAAADEAGWRLNESQRHLQVVEQNCAQLVQQQQVVTGDVEVLRQALNRQQAATHQAEQRAHDAEVAASAATRRLARAREGGRQVAEAAQQLQAQLQAADEGLEVQAQQLEEAHVQLSSSQELVAQLTAQVQLLHVQLATANNEVNILRSLGVQPQYPGSAATGSLHANHQESAAGGEARPAAGGGAVKRQTAEEDGQHIQKEQQRASDVVDTQRNKQHEELTAQLAQVQVRACAAEQQLAEAEQQHAIMKAEMVTLQGRLEQESAAGTAAAVTAQAAISQLHACQLQHRKEVEQLHLQLRSLQMARWQDDLGIVVSPNPQAEGAVPLTIQQQHGSALDALRQMVTAGREEAVNLGLS